MDSGETQRAVTVREVERWLPVAARRLAALGVDRVLLFGSWARGRASRRSDLDLLIVWPTDLPPLERIGRVLQTLRDAPLPVEPVVYTPEEFADRRDLPFLRAVLQEARVLYERGETAARSGEMAPTGRR